MFPYLVPYIDQVLRENTEFIEWLSTDKRMEQFSNLIMFLLPGDRLKYYETSNVAEMRLEIY